MTTHSGSNGGRRQNLFSYEPDDVAPAVLGEARSQPQETPDTETVFLPSRRFRPDEDSEIKPDVREVEHGQRALLVYSSLELLVAGCGQNQPWVALRVAGRADLDWLAEQCGADIVLWDAEIPEQHRRSTVDDNDTEQGGDHEG